MQFFSTQCADVISQIKRMVSSYVGENKLFESMYLNGQLEVLPMTMHITICTELSVSGGVFSSRLIC